MTDREKLIKLIQTSPADIMGNHGIGNMADHLLANGVTIADKTAVVEKPQWIPVTERLPERFVAVLLWDAVDRDVFTGELDGDDDWFIARFEGEQFTTTHWMPLPEPPREG